LQGRFDGFAAAGVEVEDLRDLIFRSGCGRETEAGGGRIFVAEVGVGGDELEEVESDVFRTTGSGVVAGFHECLSERVAKGDGSGLAEIVATWVAGAGCGLVAWGVWLMAG
jgi:hypothetical protein